MNAKIPNFAIIGAQKSASTFVQRALVDHPEVGMPAGETRLMEDPWYSEELFDEFLSKLGQDFESKTAVGIKRPDCLCLPDSARRLKRHMPDAKLVVILRNPIDRALSSYFHYMRFDSLPLLDVSEGLTKILDGGIPGFPLSENVLTYGRYGESLKLYIELFGKENMLILRHDDILENKMVELKRVYRFLGIAEDHLSKNLERRSQAVIYSLKRLSVLKKRGPLVFKWSKDRRSEVYRFGVVSRGIWYGFEAFDRFLLSKFIPSEHPVLDEGLLNRLKDYFREDLKLAETLTSLELGHWLD